MEEVGVEHWKWMVFHIGSLTSFATINITWRRPVRITIRNISWAYIDHNEVKLEKIMFHFGIFSFFVYNYSNYRINSHNITLYNDTNIIDHLLVFKTKCFVRGCIFNSIHKSLHLKNGMQLKNNINNHSIKLILTSKIEYIKIFK